MKSSLLLTGIGLRTQHYTEFFENPPDVAWLEVHSENYFAEGGKSLHILEKIRRDYPISLHGVSLSLGSVDELNWSYLKKLHDLIVRINPCLVSDHLSWSSINGHYVHDLLPLPYTEEALAHVVSRIHQIQDYLNRQILIENISAYVSFDSSSIPEWEFLNAVVKQSGCGLLLDINNIYVSAKNLDFDPSLYVSAIPSDSVQELHLAGFTAANINEKEVLIDSHSCTVADSVWSLYKESIQHLGRKPTIVEWDADLGTLNSLCMEAYKAEQIMREIYVPAKLTS